MMAEKQREVNIILKEVGWLIVAKEVIDICEYKRGIQAVLCLSIRKNHPTNDLSAVSWIF